MGLHDAAIEEFKQLAADKTRAVFAYTMIGECVEAKGELGEAVKRYKEALNLPQATAQESVELNYLLGAVFEQLGDVREALYFFENVGKRDPGFRDVKKRIVTLKTPTASSGAEDPMSDLAPIGDRARDLFLGLQDRITAAIEAADGGGRFREDAWTRPGGGGETHAPPRRRRAVREGGRGILRREGGAAAGDGPGAAGRGARLPRHGLSSSFIREARASPPCTPTSGIFSAGRARGSAAGPI